MANTGFKQAVIAYRVRKSDGAPLDINGVPTSQSGRRQAIALLVGGPNPNPSVYEVQFTYQAEAVIDGVPTVQLSNDCATGYIFATPANVVLQTSAPSGTIHIVSSAAWQLLSAPLGIATLSITTGLRGEYDILITRTGTEGQGYYVFRNNVTGQTARVHVLSVAVAEWILETGFWNNLGVWTNDGLWNY